MERAVPCAPRFRSRVFSTPQRFPGSSEFRGLVSCRSRSWDPPFRAFPSRRSLTSLEAACSPAVIHQRAVVHRSTPYHRRFHQTPALSRARLLPPTTMDLLSTDRSQLPDRPGRQTTGSPRLTSFTCFEASCPLRESVHLRTGLPRPDGSLLSWVSSPQTPSPLTPRILDPPEPRGLEHAPLPEGSRARPRGPLDPPRQVRPTNCDRNHSKQTTSAASSPLRDWPAPPLGGVSSSHDLGLQSKPCAPGPRSL